MIEIDYLVALYVTFGVVLVSSGIQFYTTLKKLEYQGELLINNRTNTIKQLQEYFKNDDDVNKLVNNCIVLTLNEIKKKYENILNIWFNNTSICILKQENMFIEENDDNIVIDINVLYMFNLINQLCICNENVQIHHNYLTINNTIISYCNYEKNECVYTYAHFYDYLINMFYDNVAENESEESEESEELEKSEKSEESEELENKEFDKLEDQKEDQKEEQKELKIVKNDGRFGYFLNDNGIYMLNPNNSLKNNNKIINSIYSNNFENI